MNLCITGGGTGGHLMIAEALLEASKDENVIFIGSTKGQDKRYFEHSELVKDVYFLETTGIVDKKHIKKIPAILKLLKAFLKAREILKSHHIEAVYSVGGFSAAPAAIAAISLKIPLFIHEQNAVAGKLNTILKPYAKSFLSAYDQDAKIKGYPVKDEFFKKARIRTTLKSVIFLGGSHGAKAINDLALSVALELKKREIKIVHQAGEFDYERVKNEYKNMGVEVELYGFTNEISTLIENADLACSRAGASTLWELTSNGCPTFYIPYPYAAGDHQYFNAKFIVDNEMGWCEREAIDLKDKFLDILDSDLSLKSKKLISYANDGVALEMIKEVKNLC